LSAAPRSGTLPSRTVTTRVSSPSPDEAPDALPLEAYRRCLRDIKVGKRLPDAVYVHRDGLPCLPDDLRRLASEAERVGGLAPHDYDVVKFALARRSISLLSYPQFFDDPFPALVASCNVDLATAAVTWRRFDGNDNPPILHRKETLLPAGHPSAALFATLTSRLKGEGLFKDAHLIGRRLEWGQRLSERGIVLEGHSVVTLAKPPRDDRAAEPDRSILRHRTALARVTLSGPMQALWRHGYLDGRHSVFDYGCGRGDDVRALRERGVAVTGWDPHFAADAERSPADVVNLGFVLNVIENPAERRETLESAFALCRRVLAVTTLVRGRESLDRFRQYGDGVVTSRATFQKYFLQAELREFVSATLGREPVAIAPGMFFVFREDGEEQRFLAARQRSSAAPSNIPRWQRPPAAPRAPRAPRQAKPPRQTPWETHRELLENLWLTCLSLGREPDETEVPDLVELKASLGSLGRALKTLFAHKDPAALERAREARSGDLLVYFALNLFERRRSLSVLPDVVRRDVRAFWGTYARAQEAAASLLFSAGQPEVIWTSCKQAHARGIGWLDGDHSLQLRTTDAIKLPPVLRIYLGCAGKLYGEVESADLVKLHIQSGKVTLTSYDDFEGRPVPPLLERVKINLRKQEIQFFDGRSDDKQQLLFLKSRYLPRDAPGFAEQAAFDKKLQALGLCDLSTFGPDEGLFQAQLAEHGLEVFGFDIRKAKPRRRRGVSPAAKRE
jgi:DNA phosphorothioation-associated putative methyltransferase